MKNIFLAALFLLATSFYTQGVSFNKEDYSQMEEFDLNALGFTNVPSSYSMRKYAPIPKMQVGQSCVGFAMGYSAMSIHYNIELGLTKPFEKTYFSFDPYFLYSLISSKYNVDCDEQTKPNDALEVLENYGCKRMWTIPFLNCSSKVSNAAFPRAKPFRINDSFVISADVMKNKSQLISALKDLISHKIVPVACIATSPSMAPSDVKNGTVGLNGLWRLSQYDKFEGAHAITIVGYSDYKYGGAFEIMNSWGSNYGDNGFMWIKYDDFIRVALGIFILDSFKLSKSMCKAGNCYNGYGLQKLADGRIEEGKYQNGKLNGWGFRSSDEGVYIGFFQNNLIHGKGFFYLEEENKFYSLSSRNGQIVDNEVLGFVSEEPTLEENQALELFKVYSNMGYVNLQMDPDNSFDVLKELDFFNE